MSPFIQPLEGRTLFAAAFAAEQVQLVADAAALRVALKSAAQSMAADVKTLVADLRPLTTAVNRAGNLGLLKGLKADIAAGVKALRLDGRNLLAKSGATARRVAATGNALAAHPGDAKLMAKLAADLPALQSITAASVAQLQADLAAIDLAPALTAISAANPTGVELLAQTLAILAGATSSFAGVAAAATKFEADIAVLAAHLDALPDTPSLVGTWAGGADETSGPEAGLHITLVAKFISQGLDGALAGTIRGTPTGGTAVNMTLVGTIAEDGTFTATGTPTGSLQSTSTLIGTLSGNTISGTYTTSTGGGTFSISRQ